jgi:hypothetical protein
VLGDADALYEFHRANGVEVGEEIGDREFWMRDSVVKDLYGYRLVFGHLGNRKLEGAWYDHGLPRPGKNLHVRKKGILL